MAPITRRTWAQLRDEAIQAGGGHDYTGFSGRLEYWMEQAYYDIALGYHHYELEKVDSAVVVALNATSIPVPADCYILMGVQLPSNGKYLTLQRMHFLTANFSTTAAIPEQYARFQTSILLNCPASAGAAGNWTLRYYKIPTAPDYSSGSPETNRIWDEHLIDATLARQYNRVWRPDLAGIAAQTLGEWVSSQVQPDLRTEIIANLPDIITSNRPTGGSQG